MTPLTFFVMSAAWVAGAVGAAMSPRGAVRLVTAFMGALGSAMALVLAALVLAGHGPLDLSFPHLLSPAGGILIHVDPEGQTDRETLLPSDITEKAE